MGLKPGLKALTPKERKHRKEHLQAIVDITFAECDNKKSNKCYTINKTNDIQKLLIEIGAMYGENYLAEKSYAAFNKNPDFVVDKLFSLVPTCFLEKNFVKDDIVFLKKGVLLVVEENKLE